MANRRALEILYFCTFLFVVVDGFLPNRLSTVHTLNPTDYTHEEITQIGVLKAAAMFLEDNPRSGTSFTPGQLQNLDPLNPTTLFTAYYGEVTSAGKLQSAITEIIDANSRVDSDYLSNAEYHVGGEEIQAANNRLIRQRNSTLGVLSATPPNFEAARSMIGVYLHILQDFYSNTNWVELEGGVPYEDLGLEGKAFRPLGIPFPTCQDCTVNSGTLDCRNNILLQSLLTSGYKSGQTKVKPAAHSLTTGKCSHGGLNDDSRLTVPTGGINKETSVPSLSPHYYLHDQATQAAIQATTNFFIAPGYGLLSQIGEENFREVLNLGSGNSMVFVIDVSGSMGDDVVAVRRETVQIVQSTTGTANAPYNYILSTFSDPAELTTIQTTRDPNEMITWLNALTVHGGGDCPEYCFSGIELALRNCLPDSKVFIFTDADPKDPEKYSSISALMQEKEAVLNFLLTGSCTRRNLQDGQEKGYLKATSHITNKRSYRDWYEQLAQESGGSVYEGDKEDIADLTGVISVALSNSAPVTLYKATLPAGSGRVVPLEVDSALLELVISLVAANSAPNVAIETPGGTQQVFGTPDAEIVVNVGTNRLYQIKNPSPGTWRLRLRDSQQYMLEVTGKSIVDFSYQFMKTTSNGILLPIDGRPVAGVNTTVIVDVLGSENVRQLTRISLVNEVGNELVSSAMTAVGGLLAAKYSAVAAIPTEEFRVKIEGKDVNNTVFQRVQPTFIQPQSFSLALQGEIEPLFAGGFTDVHFLLVNHGAQGTFSLSATDDAYILHSVSPSSTTLQENANTTGYIRFVASSTAVVGVTSTTTLTVSGPGGSSNSVVVRVTVEPQIVVTVDDVSPTCTIVAATGRCTLEQQHPSTCDSHHWSIDVQVRDGESGIYSLTASPEGSGVTFNHSTFSPGTVGTNIAATYSSNCCTPRGTVTVADKQGNIARCTVDYYIPTTTPQPTTSPPTTIPSLTTPQRTTFPAATLPPSTSPISSTTSTTTTTLVTSTTTTSTPVTSTTTSTPVTSTTTTSTPATSITTKSTPVTSTTTTSTPVTSTTTTSTPVTSTTTTSTPVTSTTTTSTPVTSTTTTSTPATFTTTTSTPATFTTTTSTQATSTTTKSTPKTDIPPTVDDVSPNCTIVAATGRCTLEQQHPSTCDSHHWSIDVQVRDGESGIYSLTASSEGSGVTFNHSTFSPGTVGTNIAATYSSTCCKPTGTVTVEDKQGNIAQCIVDYYIPTPESLTTTETPPTVLEGESPDDQALGASQIALLASAAVVVVGLLTGLGTALYCTRSPRVKCKIKPVVVSTF
ncbi:VWA7 [Branchiostoma lanceolatum]|uniref:VWA7 protein n=1 Tax=Branchiostoma lanceolatum TaxID=7740 RepID=A0A8J9Z6R4_BRALA|nr:VWA7 [Branchiostoma lanceolatum]